MIMHNSRIRRQHDMLGNISSRSCFSEMLVEHVFSQTTANTLQVGDVILQLLDCFNLLVKEIRLNEILELNKTLQQLWLLFFQ